MVDAHAHYADGVIGGAVESAAQGAWRWAIYFLDFGRYQAPFDSPHPEYVTDTNICYKREALERVRDLWSSTYQESVVNWALREQGVGLRLDPGPRTVQQRVPNGLGAMAMERIHWGLLYGRLRVRGHQWVDRLRWAAITPLLTPLLYIRNLRRQLRLKRNRLEFAKATIPMLYLLAFWSLGEMLGYLTVERNRP
jgi:hypothetical protein